jgi:murein DD-endopeptidase MepM/ murein hydrolase activator NlpD
MFNENYYKKNKAFKLTSRFGSSRKYGELRTYHAGVDYISNKAKKQVIYNLLTGQVVGFGSHQYAGKSITLRHNLKFIGGVDDELFTCYKHLDTIKDQISVKYNSDSHYNIVEPGEEIGTMGNTGYCMTKENDEWRLLTPKEKKDIKCKKGVHIHFEFYQNSIDGRITPLVQELLIMELIKNEPQYYFHRHNRLYINPDIIMSYVKFLIEKKG